MVPYKVFLTRRDETAEKEAKNVIMIKCCFASSMVHLKRLFYHMKYFN